MATADFSDIGKNLRENIGPLIGNVMTSPEFSGETAQAARQKAYRLLQKIDLTAFKADELNKGLQEMGSQVNRIKDAGNDKFLAQFDDMNEVWVQASGDRVGGKKTQGTDSDKDGGIFGNTIFDVTRVEDGHIVEVDTSKGRKPYSELRKSQMYVGLVDQLNTIFRDHERTYVEGNMRVSQAGNALPTIEQINDGSYAGKLDYTDSVFSYLNGSFQEGDIIDDGSILNKATVRGEGFNGIVPPEKPKAEDLENKDGQQETNLASATVASGGSFQPAGGTRAAGASSPFESRRRTGAGGKLEYEIDKVNPEDIYNKIKQKYGITSDADMDNFLTSNGFTPTTRNGVPGYINEAGEFIPSRKGATTTSSYIPTSTSSYTPRSFSPSSYTPSSLGSSSYTPSSYTPSSYSPSGFSSGAGYTPTSFGSAPRSSSSASTSPSSVGGMRPQGSRSSSNPQGSSYGPAPVRQNAATSGTGSSAASPVAKPAAANSSGSGSAAGGMGRAPGMGGMGMMPMGGMGGPGGGSGGGKSGNKSKITNKDQDLYGADINSVSPVIRAGSQAAGMNIPVPEDKIEEKNNEKKEG